MRSGLYLMLLALFCGCNVVYPGNGPLVVVDVDADLDACVVTWHDHQPTTFGDHIRIGLRYWDSVGARFRTRDQLEVLEHEEARRAPHLPIHGEPCELAGSEALRRAKAGDLTPLTLAQYNPDDGTISVILTSWWLHDRAGDAAEAEIQAVIAHEVGHAQGLRHVAALDAVMNAAADPRPDLSDADLREHARVWP